VKPAPFEHVPVESAEEAVAVLAEHGDEAKVLAGGQSLVPLLNMRLARPGVLVDVSRVAGLDSIEANGALTLGALVRQADALGSPAVGEHAPLLAAALKYVGHPATRNRGTVGGSLAHADPAAELPAVLLALDGEVNALGPGGERTIAAEALFTGPFTTALAADELLVRVRLPLSGGRRFGFAELARRPGDFALAGAAVSLDLPRIVLFALGGEPIRATEAEALLGQGAGAGEVAATATRDLDPVSDVHADGAYRRRITQVLVRRALEQAGVDG
jgi:CO/xanthine dehydrogenase FAD-binding subunit